MKFKTTNILIYKLKFKSVSNKRNVITYVGILLFFIFRLMMHGIV